MKPVSNSEKDGMNWLLDFFCVVWKWIFVAGRAFGKKNTGRPRKYHSFLGCEFLPNLFLTEE